MRGLASAVGNHDGEKRPNNASHRIAHPDGFANGEGERSAKGNMKYPHWYYFVALVEDLEKSSRFVEIHEDNFAVYSTEYSQLVLAACSEIDVVAKLISMQGDSDRRVTNIGEYRAALVPKYPCLPSIEVTMPRYDITFAPWNAWSRGEIPEWWKCYNRVKHQRDRHYRDANLRNAIYSIGGLAVMVAYLYHKELSNNAFNPVPRFIFILPKYSRGSITHGQPMYHLPDFPKEDQFKKPK